MLSIVIPFRNLGQFAPLCLSSVGTTINDLGMSGSTEFILIDDASDESHRIPELFKTFRASTPARCTLIRLKARKYHTYACALGFSLAVGERVLMISHDMIVPPGYVKTMLTAAGLDEGIGIVRGSSQHIDCFPQHVITPPMPCRNYQDVCKFSEYVARYHGSSVVEDRVVIADSILVNRSVLTKIGVMDTQFRHLFGDIDFGLRAQRAGFKLVCAKGAWLHHEGNASAKEMVASGANPEVMAREVRELVETNYAYFRRKWDMTLPADCSGALNIDFERLRILPPRADDFVPPIGLDAQAELL